MPFQSIDVTVKLYCSSFAFAIQDHCIFQILVAAVWLWLCCFPFSQGQPYKCKTIIQLLWKLRQGAHNKFRPVWATQEVINQFRQLTKILSLSQTKGRKIGKGGEKKKESQTATRASEENAVLLLCDAIIGRYMSFFFNESIHIQELYPG